MKWTRPEDVALQVRKWWDRGELLAGFILPDEKFPRRLRFVEPTSSEVSEHFAQVRSWSAEIRQLRHCRVQMREFRHQVHGTNTLPSEIWIDSIDDAISLIGKRKEASCFQRLIEVTRRTQPVLLEWMAGKPFRVLELSDEWQHLLAVVAWLQQHPRPNIYLRQMDLPGVDTKFVEKHRAVLAELLDIALPREAIDSAATGINRFAGRYGFKEKPVGIRFRILDPSRQPLSITSLQDVTLDRASFFMLDPRVTNVFITENETNFLAFEELADSMVIFGSGYRLEELAGAQWLTNRNIFYWGDIDTHGFSILSNLRGYFSATESLLMEEKTLLQCREFWVTEPSQHHANVLPNLTTAEQALYSSLKNQVLGTNVRLEQERIPWGLGWDNVNRVVAGLKASHHKP